MTAPEQQDIIHLDAERKSRRARFADTLGNAKTKLAPSTLAAKVSADQKKKIGEAGRRAGQYGKDHKAAVGGTIAALAAGAAGFFFYNRRKKKPAIDGAPNIIVHDDNPTASAQDLDEALAKSEPLDTDSSAAAAGAAV